MKTENDFEDCEFLWCDDHGDDAPDVIVREQPAVAVYLNPVGDVVLRQQRWPDDDSWVWFQPQHAPAIVRAILERAFLTPEEAFPELRQKTTKTKSDNTAAERQKRYRERHRNGGAAEPDVTHDRNAAHGNGESDLLSGGDGKA